MKKSTAPRLKTEAEIAAHLMANLESRCDISHEDKQKLALSVAHHLYRLHAKRHEGIPTDWGSLNLGDILDKHDGNLGPYGIDVVDMCTSSPALADGNPDTHHKKILLLAGLLKDGYFPQAFRQPTDMSKAVQEVVTNTTFLNEVFHSPAEINSMALMAFLCPKLGIGEVLRSNNKARDTAVRVALKRLPASDWPAIAKKAGYNPPGAPDRLAMLKDLAAKRAAEAAAKPAKG